MRPPSLAMVLALAALPTSAAFAESRGSAGSGSLGRTNAGIGEAVSSSSSSGSSGSSSSGSAGDYRDTTTYDGSFFDQPGSYGECLYMANGTRVLPEEVLEEPAHYSGDRSRFAAYAGLQKVHDSDGSGTLELSVTDFRFRLSGALSHYVETQGDGGRTSLSLPSLMVGVRLTGYGNTQLFVDGGVSVAISRGDPAMDTSLTAPTVGAQLVHYVSPALQLVADGRAMWFPDDVSALAGKVGVKFHYMQLSMRVLDFNVGPALWDPELGVVF